MSQFDKSLKNDSPRSISFNAGLFQLPHSSIQSNIIRHCHPKLHPYRQQMCTPQIATFPNGFSRPINILNYINLTSQKINLFGAESAKEIEKACFGKVFEINFIQSLI